MKKNYKEQIQQILGQKKFLKKKGDNLMLSGKLMIIRLIARLITKT